MALTRKPEHRTNCSRCNRVKTEEEVKCNTWTFECKDCRVITKNVYKYKISREESQRLYNTTNCEICNVDFTEIGGRRRVIDHCHNSNNVRGAICRNCNTGLGMFNDSFELINIASYYLKNGGDECTIEEKHIGNKINTLDKEYIKGFNEGAEFQKQEMHTIMQEYAEFCIECDRREMPLLLVEDWIEHFKKQ